jgi:GDP-L-fucose synthase
MQSYANERVVVTGGAGFLGRHVVEELRRRGISDVFVPRSRDYDLVREAEVERMFADVKPTVVMHLAARVGGIGANRKHPGTFSRENLALGLPALVASRPHAVRKVVFAGTICAYPKFAPVPFREDDLWSGYPEETNAPYGVAKKALLVMAQAYRQEFGSNFVVVFPVNLYGPWDNFDLEDSHVIPAMIRKFEEARLTENADVTLWGDGSPTREFLYVEDAAHGLVDALERYDEADPVNLGAGFEIAMRDLATTIQRLVGHEGRLVWDTSRPNGQPRRMLDVTRAKERFGFVATTPFESGLAETIRWWRAHRGEVLAREAARAI